MPNRIIKEGIWTSPNLNRIDDKAELLFYRLLPLPDDHGCFEADPEVLSGRLFPRKKEWTPVIICQHLLTLANNGLLMLWVENDRLYGYFPTWSKHQYIRSLHQRKTPPPKAEMVNNQEVMEYLLTIDSNCQQLLTVARLYPNPNPNPNPNPTTKVVGKSKKQKNSKTEVEQEIFNHWNNLKITIHGSIDKFLPALTTTLKVYPKENIIEAMDNLKHVIDSPDCFWTHRWGLHEFLTRKENGIDNFLTINKPIEKYRKKEDKEAVGVAAHKVDRWADVRHLYPKGKSDAYIETMERRREYEKIRKTNSGI